MTKRTLNHAFTRIGFWGPVVLGVGLLVTGTAPIAGGIIAALGGFNFFRIANKKDLHQKLQLVDDKKRHGITRALQLTEQKEVDAIVRYCGQLRELSLNPELAHETMESTWEILKNASGQDGTKDLQEFRRNLPELKLDSRDVVKRIEDDLERRKEIERELELD